VNPLNPLYDAVAWVIMRIHTAVGAVVNQGSGLAWVLTIVILVVLMRLILLPLFVKQMHATRKMTALAPQMQELRKKYKGDRQTLNEETMKLYRANGVNPLGGCLPLVAQLPLFFALFGVLRGIADWHTGLPYPYGLTPQVIQSAQHANIFGATISDKVLFTAALHVPFHAKIVILLSVVVSVVTTFMTVRQSTKRGMTPQMTPDNPMAASQKYMQYIVPLFALSGLYWQFGLVLYWMTTNIWTLGQQYVLFRQFPTLTAASAAAGAAAGGGTAPGITKAPAGPKQVSGGARQRPASPKQVTGGAKQAARPSASGSKQPTTGQKPSGNGAKPAAPAQGKQASGQGKQASGQGKQASGQGKQASAQPQGKRSSAAPAQGKRPSSTEQAKTEQAKTEQARPPGQPQAKQAAKRPSSQAKADAQQASSNGSGLLRRFGRGRAEPEQQPETPDVKLVRQQRVRQSRSKRSGKR
jgi:YidC/Oxa1 family membrane protein insertase